MPRSILLWCLGLTMLALPWYVVRFTLLGVPLTLLECLALLTIAIWVAQETIRAYAVGLFRYISNVSHLAVQNWPVVVPVSLFVIAATIAVVSSDNFTAALGIYKAYILEPILLGVVIWSTIKRRQDWQFIAGAALLAGLQVSFLAISQYLIAWPNFAPNELSQGRSSAMYNTANAVGLFVGPLTLLAGAFAVRLWQERRSVSIGLLIYMAISLIAIVLSQSTGALVAIAGSTLAGGGILLLRKFNWLNYKRWLKLVALGILVYVGAIILFMTRFNHPPQVANPYTRPGFSTFTVRQCTWEGTTSLLREKPVWGSGLAGFATDYLNYATCDAEPLVYPHNLVLNFWTETGLLGLIAMIGVVGVWLTKSGRMLISSSASRWIYLGLCLVPVYWLIHGLVDVPYFKNDLSMVWWALFALVIVGYERLDKASPAS